MKKFLVLLLLLLLMPVEARSQADVRIDCANLLNQWVACTSPGIGNTGYPPGTTPKYNSFSGADTAGQSINIVAPATQYAYVCDIYADGLGATAATTVMASLTGANVNFNWEYTYVAGVTLPNTPLHITFNGVCVRSFALGGTMQFNVPGAAGNTLVNIQMVGFFQ